MFWASVLIALGVQSLVLHFSGAVGVGEPPIRITSPVGFVWGVFTGVVFYALIAMVYSATSREAELSRAKLDTLRSQLRPHFLFNTLNAISVLVTEDTDKAQQMLLRLSTLLRRSLDEEAHEVPLRHELVFVNDYLDIQRERFGDRLTVHSPSTGALMQDVDAFLLGRRTYATHAAAFEPMPPGDPFGDLMNAPRKYVASRTLERLTWRNSPVRQLEGFRRVTLQPGETRTLHFSLHWDELQFWSPRTKNWVVEPSTFDVRVGEDSAADLHGALTIEP